MSSSQSIRKSWTAWTSWAGQYLTKTLTEMLIHSGQAQGRAHVSARQSPRLLSQFCHRTFFIAPIPALCHFLSFFSPLEIYFFISISSFNVAFYYSPNYCAGVAVSDLLCPPGTGPQAHPRISSWSWPAAETRNSARLTVWVLCGSGPSSYLTDPITQRAALWDTPLLIPPQIRKHDQASHYFKLFFPLRLGQTWRGWRTGCSSTWPECEISSSWLDWASTTTGYWWQRHSSSRLLYTEHNNRSSEWSHNVQKKPCWFCPSGFRPQRQSRSQNLPCVKTLFQPDFFPVSF